jgi:hypothetical protein
MIASGFNALIERLHEAQHHEREHLDRQEEAVRAAYAAAGFRHVATLHRDGWVTLHLKR